MCDTAASANTMETKDIIVLGGNYAGVNTAHYVLRHVLPVLVTHGKFRVVLVNPAVESFHRSAAPRALVSNELIPREKVFFDITRNFAQYPEDNFCFVQGKATAVEHDRQVVHVATGAEATQWKYHALIIATGATSPIAIHSSQNGNGTEVHEAMKLMQEQIKHCKSIVIAGGGPAGVETAGEIGEYLNGKPGWFSTPDPKISIRIITGADQLLPVLRPAYGKQAEDVLASLGVSTTYKTRVERTEDLAKGGKAIHLDDGKVIETDIFIDATGTKPSTTFLPETWLDGKKKLQVNASTLRVDIAGPRIYAIGDVGSHTRGGIMEIMYAVPVLATNLLKDLLAEEGVTPRYADREFKGDTSETQFVTLGQSRAMGAVKGIRLPGLVVWAVKGRDYMFGMVRKQFDGSHWKKESSYKPTPIKA